MSYWLIGCVALSKSCDIGWQSQTSKLIPMFWMTWSGFPHLSQVRNRCKDWLWDYIRPSQNVYGRGAFVNVWYCLTVDYHSCSWSLYQDYSLQFRQGEFGLLNRETLPLLSWYWNETSIPVFFLVTIYRTSSPNNRRKRTASEVCSEQTVKSPIGQCKWSLHVINSRKEVNVSISF